MGSLNVHPRRVVQLDPRDPQAHSTGDQVEPGPREFGLGIGHLHPGGPAILEQHRAHAIGLFGGAQPALTRVDDLFGLALDLKRRGDLMMQVQGLILGETKGVM